MKDAPRRLYEAIVKEATPCQVHQCSKQESCQHEERACFAFQHFVRTGKVVDLNVRGFKEDGSGCRYKVTGPHVATRKIYQETFAS